MGSFLLETFAYWNGCDQFVKFRVTALAVILVELITVELRDGRQHHA